MSIHKHLEEIKRLLPSIISETQKNSNTIMDGFSKLVQTEIIREEGLDKKFIQAKELNSGITIKEKEIMEKLSFLENNISLNTMKNLYDTLEDFQIDFKGGIHKIIENIKSDLSKIPEKYADTVTEQEIHLLFINFDKRDDYLEDSLKKIFSILEGDYKIIKANEKGRSVKQIYQFLRRSKMEGSFDVGKSKVFVRVKSDFNVTTGKISGEKIKTYILRIANKWLSEDDTSENLQNWLLSVKENTSKDIEDSLVEIFIQTMYSVLTSNPQLLRSSRVNIYIILKSEKEMDSSLGYYLTSRSDSSNIFMAFVVDKNIINAYLNMKKSLDSSYKQYETIIHELTHAYDYTLNKNSSETNVKYAYEVLGENPNQEVISLLRILDTLREEALARINGILRANAVNNWDSFSFDELAKNFESASKNLLSVINKSGKENSTVQELDNALNAASSDGTCHDYGMYMLLIIFIYKERHNMMFFNCGSDNMRVMLNGNGITGSNVKEFMTQRGWIALNDDEISTYLKHGTGLNIYLNNLGQRLQQLITLVSITSSPDFFKLYIEACKNLKIDPGPLTPEVIKSINSEKHKQFEKLVKNLGF